MRAYCVKCRRMAEPNEITGVKQITMKNGKPAWQGLHNCDDKVSHTKVTRIGASEG